MTPQTCPEPGPHTTTGPNVLGQTVTTHVSRCAVEIIAHIQRVAKYRCALGHEWPLTPSEPGEPTAIKWHPDASAPTNPLLTPENIVSAGPCSDPDCPRCEHLRSIHPVRYPDTTTAEDGQPRS